MPPAVPGTRAHATRPDSAGRKAFLFDPNRCTGFQACEVACAIENKLEGMSWRRVTTFN